jgi:DNA-binding transcriptional LysR family regulator
VRVTLETAATRGLLEDVRAQRLDLAVVCLPAPVTGLRMTPIAHEAIVAAVSEDHCCARERQIDLSGLQHTRLVQLARAINPAFYDGALAACHAAGIAPALVEVATPALEQVLLAVASGAGIALLPASVETRLATPGVHFKPLTAPPPACPVALVAHTDASTAAIAFLRLASGTLPGSRPLALAA